MRTQAWTVLLVTCGLALGGCAAGTPRLARVIPLPGVRGPVDSTGIPGRLDHLAYDPATRRLFVAAISNGSLEVIDLDAGRHVKSIPGLRRPQGIAIVPAATLGAAHGWAVVACGGDGTVHAYDIQTLDEKATASAGLDADNVRCDPIAGKVYVSCATEPAGGFLAVFDAKTLTKTGEIALPLHPESFQLDPASARLFANLPGPKRADTDGVVAVADRATGQVLATWKLDGLARNFPLALDAAHGRLFLACRKPAKLVALDAHTGKVLSAVACVPDCDDLFYDAQTGCVLVIGGGARADDPAAVGPPAIDVFRVGADGALALVGSTPLPPHARTGWFVPEPRAVYVAVPPQGERDAEVHEFTLPH